MGRPLASDLDLGGVWGHPQSKLWLDRAKTLRMPLAPASPPASPLESKARLVWGSVWEGSHGGVISVGQRGRASQPHSRTGSGRGRTA